MDKAKAVYRDFTDGCATGMGMDDLLQIGREIAVGIPYTMTETAPPVPNPMTLEYLVEVFSNGYTKEQVEGFVEKLGLDEVAYMAEVHAKLRYKAIEEDPTAETERPENHRMLVDAFGGAFTEQEAVSNAVAFDWDVNRAANLYKNLTDGSASHMSVEDLISAGKETV